MRGGRQTLASWYDESDDGCGEREVSLRLTPRRFCPVSVYMADQSHGALRSGVEVLHAEHGPEDLLAHDAHVAAHAREDGGLHEVSLGGVLLSARPLHVGGA